MFAFQLLLSIFQFCYDIYIQLYDGRNKSRQTKCLPLVQFHRAIYHSKHIFIKIIHRWYMYWWDWNSTVNVKALTFPVASTSFIILWLIQFISIASTSNMILTRENNLTLPVVTLTFPMTLISPFHFWGVCVIEVVQDTFSNFTVLFFPSRYLVLSLIMYRC